MKKESLSEEQLRHLDLFHLILECDGWEITANTSSPPTTAKPSQFLPEGNRSIETGTQVLEAQFHAPVNMISLSISEKNSHIKAGIFFLFTQQPEQVLEWIVSHRNKLSPATYQQLLSESEKICSTVLVSNSAASYELKPMLRLP